MSQRISTGEILDALRECVLELGVRRTTFAEVSRRADVSRMTLYRHLGDVQSGVAELMTREFLALMQSVQAETSALPTGRDRLVEAGVRFVDELGTLPLFRRVLDLDGELLLPYVFDRFGGTQRAAIAMFAAAVRAGQDDGSIRDVDADLAAHCLELVGQSFVLSRRVTESQHDTGVVMAELRHLLHAYLRPDPTLERAR
jgi:AcrR family transcriptional regulator